VRLVCRPALEKASSTTAGQPATREAPLGRSPSNGRPHCSPISRQLTGRPSKSLRRGVRSLHRFFVPLLLDTRIRQIGTALKAWVRRHWSILLGLLGVVVVLSVGAVLSFDLARQTQDLLTSANAPDPQLTPKDRADLVRNALQYQTDNLTKLWTGIAAAAVAYVGWLNFRVATTCLDREPAVDHGSGAGRYSGDDSSGAHSADRC
jgi:hypothetical protein